jgi:hypothetical protein
MSQIMSEYILQHFYDELFLKQNHFHDNCSAINSTKGIDL